MVLLSDNKWELLQALWLGFSLPFRFLWPLLLLMFVTKLLRRWLERRADGRRAQRAYLDAVLAGDFARQDSDAHTLGGGWYPADWDDLRRAVYRRADYRCQNCGCGQVELHAHHIVPLSVGGSNALANLACLCRTCHAAIHPHMRDDHAYPSATQAWVPAQSPHIAPPESRYAAKLRW